jgi:hypothetical protein
MAEALTVALVSTWPLRVSRWAKASGVRFVGFFNKRFDPARSRSSLVISPKINVHARPTLLRASSYILLQPVHNEA